LHRSAWIMIFLLMPPHPIFLLKWGLTNFLPGLVSNLEPPDLCLLSSWCYISEPLCPAHGTSSQTLTGEWWMNRMILFFSLRFLSRTNKNKQMTTTTTKWQSYSGGQDQEYLSSKQAQANRSQDPISKRPNTKKGQAEWLK
jgi:hypothetical protein